MSAGGKDRAYHPPVDPLRAGLAARCPRCAEGRLFSGFLGLRERCGSCGLDYGFADAGDGPAAFVIAVQDYEAYAEAMRIKLIREIEERKKAEEALKLLEIDELGLEAVDRKILDTIIRKFAGGPVGLGTVSASVMEEEDTIEEIYEPYLMQLGFLERTPRGRLATPRAYEHLGLKAPSDQQKLI